MPVLGWEKTITCPYNPSHQITVERIQFHLVKCRKNHAGSDLKVCPFNASHHVPAPEEAFHMKTCSDRKVVEMEKYSWSMQQPRQHGNLKLPVREGRAAPERRRLGVGGNSDEELRPKGQSREDAGSEED